MIYDDFLNSITKKLGDKRINNKWCTRGINIASVRLNELHTLHIDGYIDPNYYTNLL